MDVSPVQSGSKCSSDFSIERILSSDTKRERSDSDEAPSWLCCTRYQPPRIPRASTSGCRSRRSGRHARVPFTAAQAAALEAAFARAHYLAPPALRALAAALQLRDDRIKIWFQNRRARVKREKSTTITPPRAVTLPPTSQSRITNALLKTFQKSDFNGSEHAMASSTEHSIDDPSQSLRTNSSCSDSEDEIRPDTPVDIESID